MLAQKGALAEAELAQLQQLLAQRCDVGPARRERLTEGYSDAVGKLPWPFGEKSAALVGEDRAPELVQPHGDDRHFGLPCEQFVASSQAEKRTAAFELSFGKEANDLTRAHRLRADADSILYPPCGDRNRADDAKNRMQHGVVVELVVDNEP